MIYRAKAQTLKENGVALMNTAEKLHQKMNKFSAGVFCFFMGVYIFNGIQASFAGLFDAKKKEARPVRTKHIKECKKLSSFFKIQF